ncbi:MAG: hypothetical protein ACNA8H_07015 [Anaerolineales bacterium]
MSRIVSLLCILVSTATLFYSYLVPGYWIAALGFIMLGLIWVVSLHYKILWFSSLALLIQSAAAAAGIWVGLSSFLMAFAALNGLLAWDLNAFNQRLQLFPLTHELQIIEQRHLYWLGLAAICGFLLSSTAGILNIQFSFFITLGLIIFTFVGMIQLLSWMRKLAERVKNPFNG